MFLFDIKEKAVSAVSSCIKDILLLSRLIEFLNELNCQIQIL